MQDNNGNYIFFSNIGKKFKDSKEIKLKHKKIYIKKLLYLNITYILQQVVSFVFNSSSSS